MTRAGYEEVHAYLAQLGMPAGDSCWLFDPSGGDFGLFTHDVQHPGPQHHWLLDEIAAGRIDILHSAGSYGAQFNRGYAPQRDEIARALDYLAAHAGVPRIWTNHGDACNRQNIGGRYPSAHHEGDLPGSDSYCLDLLEAHGVKHFWLDRLVVRDEHAAYRVVADERCRDGRTIATFQRFLSSTVEWSPNAQNFADQLRSDHFDAFVANEQDVVLYTHWGCHHEGHRAFTPQGEVLTRASRTALEQFAARASAGTIRIVGLGELLAANAARPHPREIQRLGAVTVRTEADKADTFYYNQFHRHGFEYFRERIRGLEVQGHRALDAGCGVGQWTYALRERFDVAHGIELNADALHAVAALRRGLRDDGGPVFTKGSIEALPYADASFDLVFCHGVLFCARMRRTLLEFARVLAPGGQAYLCINGDGWYDYLCNERFKDLSDEAVLPYAEPIWNALIGRVGGVERYRELASTALVDVRWDEVASVRRAFLEAFVSPTVELPALFVAYSDRTIRLLGVLARRDLERNAVRAGGLAGTLRSLHRAWSSTRTLPTVPSAADFPLDGLGAANRAILPDEMKVLAQLVGLELTQHAPEAGLSGPAMRPIHQASGTGLLSVWECLVRKPAAQPKW